MQMFKTKPFLCYFREPRYLKTNVGFWRRLIHLFTGLQSHLHAQSASGYSNDPDSPKLTLRCPNYSISLEIIFILILFKKKPGCSKWLNLSPSLCTEWVLYRKFVHRSQFSGGKNVTRLKSYNDSPDLASFTQPVPVVLKNVIPKMQKRGFHKKLLSENERNWLW